MKAAPIVSVYLPTHNRAELLARAIQSVLRQTFTDFELIVVDDGSTDITPVVIQQFVKDDHRVKGMRSDKSQGAPTARNMAIQAATGIYITGLDDDDEMKPKRLEQLLANFRPEYSLISSSAIRKTAEFSTVLHAGAKTISLNDLLYRNVVGTQVLTFRDRINVVGGFDPSFPASQDYDLWIRLVEKFGPAQRIGSPSYVIHEDLNLSRISDSKVLGAARLLEKHARIMDRAHIQSRRLEMLMMSAARLTLTDMIRLTNRENIRRSCRYFITCRLPWLRRVASRVRLANSAGLRRRD